MGGQKLVWGQLMNREREDKLLVIKGWGVCA